MTKTNETNNENTLYAWATGKFASIAIGLATGIFIYRSGIIQKVGNLWKSNSKTNSQDSQETTQTNN
jgi:hypothetical protein